LCKATASSTLKLIDFGLAGFAQQLRENAIEAQGKLEFSTKAKQQDISIAI
jgi:hypothetical protein